MLEKATQEYIGYKSIFISAGISFLLGLIVVPLRSRIQNVVDRYFFHGTQPELAERSGVGLRFVRELEQGKPSVRLDKVKQVLDLLGHELCLKPKS